jgi:hypothetical protein
LRPAGMARRVVATGASVATSCVSVLDGGLMAGSPCIPWRSLLTNLLKQFNNVMNGCNQKAAYRH